MLQGSSFVPIWSLLCILTPRHHGGEYMRQKNFLEIEPVRSESDPVDDSNKIVQLQLAMATSSINHEYARVEFDDTADAERKEELLEFMNACRQKYFEARESLENYDPTALQEFETDLMQQKLETLQTFNA